MEQFYPLLQLSYFGNTVQEYAVATLILILGVIIFAIIKNHVLKKLTIWATKTKTSLDDEVVKVLDRIPKSLYFFGALYIALQFLTVDVRIEKGVEVVLTVLAFFWATRVAGDLIEYVLFKASKKEKDAHVKSSSYYALNIIAKLVLWSIGLLLVLSNLGVNISALVASLGIGGIAIALALQNILSDLFSSFSIYLDKPFEIGDYIIVGDHQGTVKKIGLKTTRVEALQGEEIVISNNELTSTRVRNFKRMKKRRVVFSIGVEYGTAHAKLKKIPKMMQAAIKSVKKCTFDRSNFASFGDSSLKFETVYHLESNDYKEYMATQEKINLAVVQAFEKEKIEMAFPTQTLYVHKAD